MLYDMPRLDTPSLVTILRCFPVQDRLFHFLYPDDLHALCEVLRQASIYKRLEVYTRSWYSSRITAVSRTSERYSTHMTVAPPYYHGADIVTSLPRSVFKWLSAVKLNKRQQFSRRYDMEAVVSYTRLAFVIEEVWQDTGISLHDAGEPSRLTFRRCYSSASQSSITVATFDSMCGEERNRAGKRILYKVHDVVRALVDVD